MKKNPSPAATARLNTIAKMIEIVREEDPNHPFMVGDSRDVPTNLPKDRSDFFP